jgi:hypothetical protein
MIIIRKKNILNIKDYNMLVHKKSFQSYANLSYQKKKLDKIKGYEILPILDFIRERMDRTPEGKRLTFKKYMGDVKDNKFEYYMIVAKAIMNGKSVECHEYAKKNFNLIF